MDAGQTTVVAHWKADGPLGLLTSTFYGYYKRGFSSAEALQQASLEPIKDKSNNMHEPYHWADLP